MNQFVRYTFVSSFQRLFIGYTYDLLYAQLRFISKLMIQSDIIVSVTGYLHTSQHVV